MGIGPREAKKNVNAKSFNLDKYNLLKRLKTLIAGAFEFMATMRPKEDKIPLKPIRREKEITLYRLSPFKTVGQYEQKT